MIHYILLSWRRIPWSIHPSFQIHLPFQDDKSQYPTVENKLSMLLWTLHNVQHTPNWCCQSFLSFNETQWVIVGKWAIQYILCHDSHCMSHTCSSCTMYVWFILCLNLNIILWDKDGRDKKVMGAVLSLWRGWTRMHKGNEQTGSAVANSVW